MKSDLVHNPEELKEFSQFNSLGGQKETDLGVKDEQVLMFSKEALGHLLSWHSGGLGPWFTNHN